MRGRKRNLSIAMGCKTPQCTIFPCNKHSDNPCCHFCYLKQECGADACKNHPDRCNACIFPVNFKKKDEDQAVNSYDIPDHPVIRQAERFGGGASASCHDPVCPECSEECLIVYTDRYGAVVGCENCISSKNAAAFFGKPANKKSSP